MMRMCGSELNLEIREAGHKRVGSLGLPRNCLGDLTSGHGFDNGCMCFEPVFSELKACGECVCGVSSHFKCYTR